MPSDTFFGVSTALPGEPIFARFGLEVNGELLASESLVDGGVLSLVTIVSEETGDSESVSGTKEGIACLYHLSFFEPWQTLRIMQLKAHLGGPAARR